MNKLLHEDRTYKSADVSVIITLRALRLPCDLCVQKSDAKATENRKERKGSVSCIEATMQSGS
jgi:hypothetical protein